MAAPTVTQTVVGGPFDLTAAARLGQAAVTDTGTYDPPALNRAVEVNAVSLGEEVGVTSTISFAASGTYPVDVVVTNADGSASGTPVDVVVTDDLEDTPPATYTPIGGSPRVLRKDMPREYGDGGLATAGMPTVSGANAARYLGDASRVAAATDGLVVTERGNAFVVDLT